jgi:signal transduction histidine kinase
MEPRKISLRASLYTLPVRLRNLLAAPLRQGQKPLTLAASDREKTLAPSPPQKTHRKKARKSIWHRRGRIRARLSEVKKYSQQLEELNRLQAEFIANVSHEFRTPLNGILGYTELLRDGLYGELTPEQLNVLHHIRDCGHHLLDLVNEVLDLSRLKKHQVQLELESISPVELIEAAAAAVQPLAKQKRLDLMTRCEPDLPMLQIDFRRLYQVLLNLLGNAIKFTNEGKVEIGAARDGKNVRFHVKDTGIGIAPDFAPHVFKDFRQKDGTPRPFGGVGLGLSLSKRLVELHGGTIGYATKQGVGTEFYFYIPL